MLKYFFIAVIVLATIRSHSQDNGKYIDQPFSICNSSGKTVIAGNVNTFVYSNFFGKDLKKENYVNPHAKPEYLVYELFQNIRIKNLNAIDKLYDTSFNRKDFVENSMVDLMRPYDDIRFRSKFTTGDRIIIRYDFVSRKNSFPCFAAVKKVQGEYYLTSDLNLSDPFNVVGSLSPYNLFDGIPVSSNIDHLMPFYFIDKENKIFFTTEKPDEDHTTVYLNIEHYDGNNKSVELDILKQLQKAAAENDTSEIKTLVMKSDWPLLDNTNYRSTMYDEILKIFGYSKIISPLGSVQTNSGKIIYFQYSNTGQDFKIGSIALKKWGYKYYLSVAAKTGDADNVIQNVYVQEAIYDYFNRSFH